MSFCSACSANHKTINKQVSGKDKPFFNTRCEMGKFFFIFFVLLLPVKRILVYKKQQYVAGLVSYCCF